MRPELQFERPRSLTLVAMLLAAEALLAGGYAICIAAAVLPFNSGSWAVGEDVAMRGWMGYGLSALVHVAAAGGLWRRWRWARWLSAILLVAGLLPAVPGISASVVDLRMGGIALWGTLIALRSAGLYVLMDAGE